LIQKQYPPKNHDNKQESDNNPRNNLQQNFKFQRKPSSPSPHPYEGNKKDSGGISERKRYSDPHGEERTRFPSRRKYRYNNSKQVVEEEVNYGDPKK
jgi:hypothetical protein